MAPPNPIRPQHPYFSQPNFEYDLERDESLKAWAQADFPDCAFERDSVRFASRAELLSCIAAEEAELKGIWRKFQGHYHALAKLKLLAAPIRTLPDEMLQEIFSHIADQVVLPAGHSKRTSLMLVCKRWNDVIQACPFIWARWQLDASTFHSHIWMREMKNLTGPTNLDISLSGTLIVDQAMLERVVRVSSRFQRLELFNPAVPGERLQYCFANFGFRNLISLTFNIYHKPERLSSTPVKLERLRILSLVAGYPPRPIIAPQLTTLVLMRLGITKVCFDVFQGNAASIQKLQLEQTFQQDRIPFPPPNFNHLIQFEGADISVLMWLSPKAPKLRTIQLNYRCLLNGTDWKNIPYTAMNSVEAIISPISSGETNAGSDRVVNKFEILHSVVPLTRRLTLKLDKYADSGLPLWQLLRSPVKDPLFPHLEQLEVTYRFWSPYEAFPWNLYTSLVALIRQRHEMSQENFRYPRRRVAECRLSIQWQGAPSIEHLLPVIRNATFSHLTELDFHGLEDHFEGHLGEASSVASSDSTPEVSSDGEEESSAVHWIKGESWEEERRCALSDNSEFLTESDQDEEENSTLYFFGVSEAARCRNILNATK
jgi:hypothetical protein